MSQVPRNQSVSIPYGLGTDEFRDTPKAVKLMESKDLHKKLDLRRFDLLVTFATI